MHKIFKLICVSSALIIFFVVAIYFASQGFLGPKLQYHFWKSLYNYQNPKNKPFGEIVIDLNEGTEFIKQNSSSDIQLKPFTWWTGLYQSSENGHLGLQTILPQNPFAYYKLKIILNNTTLTIPNFLILYVRFKDFYNEEYRIKNPNPNGIDSIEIYSIGKEIFFDSNNPFQRKNDYNSAFSQHQALTSMFDNLGFKRNPKLDEIEKIDINNNPYLTPCLEYKAWEKNGFIFKLLLENSFDKYSNCIHIISTTP